ncbi:MAG: LptF/LptG family permease [Candidatus Cloacimonetes bacterium]|nr:LptF/LptG family permease [Candidatus Cloacimonadota bacterium]
MRILDKYIIKQYLISLLIMLASISLLFIIVEVVDRLPRILKYSQDTWLITQYFFYRLPYIFVLVFPVIVLLSGLFLMNSLSKFNESIAIRAAGISIFRMVLPLLLLGLVMSAVVMLFGDYVLPAAENKRAKIYYVDMRNQEIEDVKMRQNIYYSDDKFIFYLGFFDGYNNKIRVVDITQLDEEFRVVTKTQANEATWDGENWVFSSAYIRHFTQEILLDYQFYETIILEEITVTPLDFIKSAKKPMEMNFFELKEYIARLRKIGEKHHQELVELYTKVSYPLANFIILLFCVPLASASVRSKGRGMIFLLGLLICFPYLMILRISQSLGYNAVITPLTAAWFPHILFLIIGMFFVLKSEV